MSDGEVALAIAAFESALRVDHPDLPRLVHRLERRHALNAVGVAALLAIGSLLLVAGLGTSSLTLWALGLGALGLSVVLDRTYQRRLRQAR